MPDIDVQVPPIVDTEIGFSPTDSAGRLKDTAMDACRTDLMRVASEAKTDWCSGISSLYLGSVSRTLLVLAIGVVCSEKGVEHVVVCCQE